MIKVLHEQDVGYTFVGYRSEPMSSIAEAVRAVADVPMGAERIDLLLSAEGSQPTLSEPITYRKYILDAYLNDSLVDRIVFVCASS